MTARVLQALGVVFVLTLVGGALAGFSVLKDRVRVVVAADAAAAGPDPIALLRDDVQVLAGDLAALQAALPQNLERLAGALDQQAAARHAQVLAMSPRVTAIERQLASMQHELTRLREAAATAASAPVPEPAPAPAPVPEPSAAPAAEPLAPVADPGAAAAAPAAKPAGFLSFALPATTFRVDEPQDYVLLPELSRVGFDAKSTLHDFSGVTSAVRGAFRLDFDDPDGAWSGEVRCAAATLATGVDGRDAAMREHLATEEHPDIVFRLERFAPAAGGIDVAARTASGQIAGTMTIRGKAQPLRMPVTLSVDPQRRLVVQGQVALKLSDYDVPVPSQLGLIRMQDEVVVWVALRARPQGGGPK